MGNRHSGGAGVAMTRPDAKPSHPRLPGKTHERRRCGFAAALFAGLTGFLPLAAPQLALAQGAATAPAHPAARQADAFVREDLASNAVRLETRLRAEPGAGQRPGAPARQAAESALGRGQWGAAMAAARDAIVANGKDAAAWLLWARAAREAAPGDRANSWRLRNDAIAAAYAGYQFGTDRAQKAGALAELGAALAAASSWRPALNAYAASLALVETPNVRAIWTELRKKHGFRITNYKVDSDAASPRVCFTFSEPLARGRVDFAPFVALAGAANAAVTTEGQQLCVDGLRHGQTYGVVLRQGVPSAVGEDLLANADYQIYVRDRSAMARFTGRNYVLPRTGQEGIPVVSVNTNAVRIELARIGDRSLLPTVRSGNFMAQLSRYGVDEVLTQKGYKVWSGDLEVKSQLNADVITAFPVQEATGGRLEPGVYVMTAQPVGAVPLDRESDYGERATQWFVVSDLGLTAVSSENGVRTVVRSLATAKPVSGVEVRLIARNNDVLATQKSDASGVVAFDPGLARGKGGLAPGMVVASGADGDYGFLDLEQTAFDLSDRGVKGREAPGQMDAFLFTERGVYRSGETVFLTALLRDNRAEATTGAPLTLVVRRPDGVEYRRAVVEDQGLGGRSLSIPLLSGAQGGAWRVKAYVDPKGDSVGETAFLVEDYVPERLEVNLKPAAPLLQPGEPAQVTVDARYLYGAPGSGLTVSGEVGVSEAPATAVKGLDGYQVGIDDEKFEAVTAELEETVRTDGSGRAVVSAPVSDVAAARPLQATVTLRVGEDGGRAVSRSVTLPILPSGPVIGVKRLFSELNAGATANFDVVMAQPDGARMTRPLKWSLYKVERRYQWFNSDGRWNSEPVKTSRRVSDGVVEATAGAPARIAAPVDWGSWRLEVASDGGGGAVTSVSFHVGYGVEASADTPDALEVTLDKAAYKAGDMMQARINARFAGTATLMIVTDRVQHEQAVSLAADGTTVNVPVKADWGAGAYAVAFAHRPLDVAAKRMPGRALGLSWFSIDREQRELGVTLAPPAQMRPRGALAIPVTLTGLKPGEEAFVTVAAVDVGILNLTRYEPPKPQDYYLGQRQLGAELRDLYGYLIDGMQGARGALRSGGDAAALMQGDAPTQEPLARYSGVVKVGPDGKAVVNFDIPSFNGTVRVMATAWSAGRVGSAHTDVVVRDPVVVTATAPRFMAIGDQSRLHVQVDNVDAAPGDYAVNVDLAGPGLASADALSRTLKLAKGGKASFEVPLTATGKGVVKLAIQVNGRDVEASQTVALRTQPGAPALARRTVRPLPPGASVELTGELLADLVPGTGVASVAATQSTALNAPALLRALDLYPYGCTEQTVSKALPLLYSNQLAAAHAMPADNDADRRVNDAIARVLSRQDSNGSFGLWSVGGDDVWLDAYVSDFLTRARERGFSVPQQPFDLALERLRNTVANAGDFNASSSDGLAYAIYVLARNGRPVMGDLRYLADTKIRDIATPLGRAQVGAALALLGDRPRANSAFGAAVASLKRETSGVWRADYGSRLRDGAAILALAAEAGVGADLVQQAASVVEQARAMVTYTSTQENVWLLLAALALEKDAKKLRISFNGETTSGALFRNLDAAALAQPVRISNAGDEPAQLTVTTSGNPLAPEPELSRGYKVERAYYRLDGTKVDPATLRQNDRLAVVLRITEAAAENARLLVVDHLPAGVEIENPKLVEGASLSAFAWMDKDQATPSATEFRDDRFVVAYERRKGQPAFINVGYIIRVVSPGRFVHPPATAEDMYRPDRFGRSASGVMTVEAARKP
ncbi:alpha-2-macroglobulin family protein [Camelimonas lactis]|uniref:Alpha-2-macroglobulin family protein n=1 Tax=Camelimonas lactis TaxID=659006 RepID=A0A4R2GYE2_9HYPH|nr:alpha-2-macroglobulin [Camelimonas lactis]TCO16310.1 hypothetical protein EV666_101565 [Camelimonas lactis]